MGQDSPTAGYEQRQQGGVTFYHRKLYLVKAVALLLKKGASIRIRNKHRETPLHFGARSLNILNS